MKQKFFDRPRRNSGWSACAESIPSLFPLKPRPTIARWWPAVFAFLFIALATLSPANSSGVTSDFCLICGERGVADAVLNIIMFVPFGAALYYASQNIRLTIFATLFFTGTIEVMQIWLPGRDASAGDLLFNTIGGVLGIILAFTGRSWLAPQRRLAAAFTTFAAAALVLILFAYLLGPVLPRTTYFGQWMPRFDHLAWYRGRVLEARVGDVSVPSHRMRDSELLRSRLRAGATIAVRFIAGPPVGDLAPILGIADDEPSSIRFLGIEGTTAAFSYKTRAAALRFDQPGMRVKHAFANVAQGDTLTFAVKDEGDSYCIETVRSVCGVGYRLKDTWGVLYFPRRWSLTVRSIIGLMWLAGLFAPLGFFLVNRRDFVFASAAVTVTLVAIPYVTTVMQLTAAELAASLTGVALGATARRLGATRIARYLSKSPINE